MRATLDAGITQVLGNIRLGLTNDLAKEEAIALFRIARCLLPMHEGEEIYRRRTALPPRVVVQPAATEVRREQESIRPSHAA